MSEQPRAVWCCSMCGAIYHKDFPRCPADGAEVVMADRDPLLGSAIGHYTIDHLIGEGGMGRVYLAHHAHLPNKRYAFKVLLGDHSASSAMRARFTREAERASQLDHPNVVRVVDFGQTRHGLLYIVMDYVEGPSLMTLIGDVPMAPARVIGLTRAICKGLAHAHAAGIVHRDLKPENILVSAGPDGEIPRIVDFGLALSIDQSDARLTESGMTMGTPAFAAPEQISGKPIDHRADLYALGMSMFEMLTGGMTPFEGHMMEMVSARTARDAPRISARVPELAIPPELDDIVARLTRRKAAERYASARDVIDALDGVRLGAEAAIPTEPLAITGPRRRGRIAAGLVAACSLVAAAWFVPAQPRGAFARWPPGAPSPAAPLAIAAPEPGRPALAAASLGAPAGTLVSASAAAPSTVPAHAGKSPRSRDADRVAPGAPVRPATPGKRRPPRVSRERAARKAVQVEPALVEPSPSPVPVVAAPRPAQVAPLALRARIDGVDVNGSLPRAAVQRAIERRWAAIEQCMPELPETVVARFTIGEARRAQGVRAVGPTAQTNACITAAFSDVRTEAAPDVGDVEVTVRIAFVVKT